jgi:FAD/FMN-containing dehydrogenase/ferredoxin
MSEKKHKENKSKRVLYSSDISIFELIPSGVFFPKNQKELQRTLLNTSARSIHPRGAGTSAAGQSLGKGLVIDFTRHMNKIIKIASNYVDIEPGIILSELNKKLKEHGTFMPVDPSSEALCSVGGMVANNSSGIHSYLYGDTKDYVLELEGFYADGSFFSTYTGKNIDLFKNDLELLEPKLENLKSKIPISKKNSSGYNIKYSLLKDKKTPWKERFIQILIASEGTLAIISKIRLRTIKIPEKRITIFALFENIEKSIEAVTSLKKIKNISAVELLDNELIEVSLKHIENAKDLFTPQSKAGLIIELDGKNDEILSSLEDLKNAIKTLALKTQIEEDENKRKTLWRIRKSASSILNRTEGSTRSLRFIEDVAVPFDSIMKFYIEEKKILDKHGLRTAFFGHIGTGHFHINPRVDTRSKDFMNLVDKVALETYELVLSLGGTLAGEHGDGILRQPYIQKLQPELYELFLEIKKIFDPDWLLNPGKIVSRRKIFRESNRYAFIPIYDLDKEALAEIEKCNGCNECMNFCESYKKHPHKEGYKARGRANLMRAIVNGSITKQELPSALKYINSCKQCGKCRDECPAGVDIMKISSILREAKILPLSLKQKIILILKKLFLSFKEKTLVVFKHTKR